MSRGAESVATEKAGSGAGKGEEGEEREKRTIQRNPRRACPTRKAEEAEGWASKKAAANDAGEG